MSDSARRVARRAALKKAAVGGGVAGAAWVAPKVGRLSHVPTYAAASTHDQPNVTCEVTCGTALLPDPDPCPSIASWPESGRHVDFYLDTDVAQVTLRFVWFAADGSEESRIRVIAAQEIGQCGAGLPATIRVAIYGPGLQIPAAVMDLVFSSASPVVLDGCTRHLELDGLCEIGPCFK